ncbi:MAG: DnaA/Hda family protein [Pirellulaceae bacterium]
MVKEDIEILSAVRLALIDRVGEERFSLWFGANTKLQVVEGEFSIEASTRMTLDFLRKKFHEAILAALSDAGLSELRLVYRENPNLIVENAKATTSSAESVGHSGAVSSATSATVDEGPSSGRIAAKRAAKQNLIQRRKFASLRDFVVGPCNSMARTAASMVMNQPGQVSPLFICGPAGSGKTHLLEGIYSEAQRGEAFGRVVYLSAEQFTTFFLEALSSSGVASFRRKYRDVGLLLIDDIQFFAGKRATKTELLHTIDSISRRGGQVILSANKRPTELTTLGTELIARCSGGLICQVESLDFETRRQVICQAAKRREVELSPGLVDWLTTHLPGDGRMVAGAINRLWVAGGAMGKTLDVAQAEPLLTDLVQRRGSMVRIDDIEQAVCKLFGVESKLLRSESKSRRISHPRMLAMWLARKHTGAALSDICQHFHRRSHSTVISAEKKVNQWLASSDIVQIGDHSLTAAEAIQRVESEMLSR